MEQQHGHAVSVDFGLEFSPIEPVPEQVIVVRRRSVLHQSDLGHEVSVVCFHVADHGEVPSGISDVHVDDLPVLGGRLVRGEIFKLFKSLYS